MHLVFFRYSLMCTMLHDDNIRHTGHDRAISSAGVSIDVTVNPKTQTITALLLELTDFSEQQ